MANQYYQLRPNISHDQAVLVESGRTVLARRDIEIERGQFSKKPWPKIFPALELSNCRRLSLYANEAKIELPLLFAPRFPHLQELILSCNKIVSVDSLAWLQAPLLQDIVLLTNYITNVRSLRKGGFRKLKEINLSNNPIQDPSFLAELPSPCLEEVHVQRWPNLPMIGESKRWAVKLQPSSQQLKALSLRSNGRRSEHHIDLMLQARYSAFKRS